LAAYTAAIRVNTQALEGVAANRSKADIAIERTTDPATAVAIVLAYSTEHEAAMLRGAEIIVRVDKVCMVQLVFGKGASVLRAWYRVPLHEPSLLALKTVSTKSALGELCALGLVNSVYACPSRLAPVELHAACPFLCRDLCIMLCCVVTNSMEFRSLSRSACASRFAGRQFFLVFNTT
jgi:hypothetical protein